MKGKAIPARHGNGPAASARHRLNGQAESYMGLPKIAATPERVSPPDFLDASDVLRVSGNNNIPAVRR